MAERTPQQNAKRSQRKGAQFERDVAKRLREVFGDGVVRGYQRRIGGGREEADVVCPLVHVECKVGAQPNIRAAYEQALRDSEGKGLTPVAITKWDRGHVLATISFEDFCSLLDAKNRLAQQQDAAEKTE